MPVTYPNETAEYRAARDELLQSESALRTLTARVAEQRRALPPGGRIAEDYAFTHLDGTGVTASSLAADGNGTLGIYSLMYAPDADAPCPMCVSMLDGLAAQMRHIRQRMRLVVVASASTDKLKALSDARDWGDLTLLSAAGTTYQRDYHGETPDGSQLPMLNVFQLIDGVLHHFWGSELFFADLDGQPRHVDQLWPLWNMFDLTPEGRGNDWYPALSYPG